MYLIPALDLLVMVFALVDIIRADRWSIRHLDKSIWIIIVILLPLIGAVLWFILGRDYGQAVDRGSFGDPRRREAVVQPESSTERELAALEREIAQYEQDDRIRRLEAKLRARQGENTPENSES
ncbi:PLDc N-terminal domain-containing protein [Lacisediminihabitans sp. H27-G8]|uniref:PLDc N-terminal domain-containing protein n=1 Tax=Lacisediminihabitans sp. H27-G8 TaxID=3111909 RepID=UPI0038FC68BE